MEHINKSQLSPRYIKIGEDLDFYELFRAVERQSEICFLFESLGDEKRDSRFHVIGFDPKYILSSSDKYILKIEDSDTNEISHVKTDNAYFELRKYMPTPAYTGRYHGGLYGYISYECMNLFENCIDLKVSKEFDYFQFGVYLDGLVFDQYTNEIFYFYTDVNRIEKAKRYFSDIEKVYGEVDVEYLGDSMNEFEHSKTVERVKCNICDGRVFQCEVGIRSEYRIKGDVLLIYKQLRSINPSPYMFFMKFGSSKLLGASPELLFRLTDGIMETFPLAGTTKRGKDAFEDTKLARGLLNNPKEIAEHNMLVDLHRNDLGRVAKFGSVKIRRLMDIKKFSHVQHISSEITGMLEEGTDMFLALAANFPAGTLTGAPKYEAMKIIDDNEQEGRGPYGGAVGRFGFNGNCNFAIPIRSLFISGEKAYVQTSGGNVYDSTAKNEYIEIKRKLYAMKSILDQFNSGSNMYESTDN